MKFKTFVFLMVFAAITLHAGAQTPEIDSLLNVSEKAKGRDKVDALSELSKKFCTINPQKGIEYGKQSMKIAESQNLLSTESKIYNALSLNFWALADMKSARSYCKKALENAKAYNDSMQNGISNNTMGLIYESEGKFDSALIVFNIELNIFKSLKNDERTGVTLENIGTIHLHCGELKSAITYLLEAKTLYEKCNNKNKLPYIYLKLGDVYSESKDFSEALKWNEKGIAQSLAMKDTLKTAMGLNSVGIIYKEQKKYEAALAKYNEALMLLKNLNNMKVIMAIYGNIGNVYVLQEKFALATTFEQKALELAIKLNMPSDIAIKQFNLGDCYLLQNDFLNARKYYEKALPFFEDSKSQSNLLTTYQELIKANNSLKDYAQSAKYYQLFIDLKDTLNKTELNTALDSLKVKFKTEQTDEENIALSQKTEIQNKTISIQRIILFSSLLFLILLTSLILVVIRNRRKIKKANELLEIQNFDISSKAEELRITNNKLVELSEFKDVMNSFLVHDLKNPLNTIINIDTMQNSEQQIAVIQQSGRKMLNLVMNLLDISKYKNKTMKISAEDTAISHIINKAYSDVQYLAEQKSISFKSNIISDFIVNVDADMIERVFINLFSNAIKYSPTGESIKVFAECVNETGLKIIVKDSGEGIEPEYIPLIFDKFTQARAKHSGSARSTGIGLASCKMAVEAHSGKIGVESVVGQGTSFWFTIPLAESQNDSKIDPPVFIESSDLQNKIQLSDEEIKLLASHCDSLKKLSIYQISDVKDILNSMGVLKSTNIAAWKSELLKALADCNELKYKELINLISNDKL